MTSVSRYWTGRLVAALLLVLGLTTLALPAQAQDSTATSASASGEECPMGDFELTASSESASSDEAPSRASGAGAASATVASGDPTTPTPVLNAATPTEAEARVQEMLKTDGVHVVHFWAPWCPNATNELKSGWAELVRQNPEVHFVFVSIWNDGEDGASVLDRYDVPPSVDVMALPDPGPSDDKSQRRRQFLGLPVTWSPSTWIFHQNGELAFAMNYGEMPMSTVQELIDVTRTDW